MHLHYSDLWKWAQEDDLFDVGSRVFGVDRLAGVKTLGSIAYITRKQDYLYFLPFHHNRFSHSLTVALVAGEIGKQNQLSRQEVDTLIVSGIIHDRATPAKGDLVMRLDKKNLDEEKWWAEGLTEKAFLALDKLGICDEDIDMAIKGEGKLGSILDIADKITYVCQDLYFISANLGTINRNDYLLYLHLLLKEYPKIGNIYQRVMIRDGEAFFEDPKELGRFLMLRANLFRNLYNHPINQAREKLLTAMIKPFYNSEGPIADKPLFPKALRELRDFELMDFLFQQYRPALSDRYLEETLAFWYPSYDRFSSLDQARAKERRMVKDGKYVSLGVDYIKGFKAAVDSKTVDEQGRVDCFSNLYPQRAAKIDAISKEIEGYYVYYVPNSNFHFVNLIKTLSFS